MVYILSYCLKIFKKKLIGYSYIQFTYQTSHFPLGHQYRQLLGAPKLALSIPCYSTQVNAIEQLLYYQEKSLCVGVNYYMMREA